MELRANKLRRDFAGRRLFLWEDAAKDERLEIRKQNRERLEQLIQTNRLRREASDLRLQQAKEHYEECQRILSTYQGPGGGKAYRNAEEAARARKRYKTAHATVYARTPNGRAASRVQDGLRRLRGRPRTRRSRPDGVREFYRRMYSEPQVCLYCQRELAVEDRVGDHFIPLAKGGEHAWDNLVVACRDCNGKKKDLWPSEFISNM